MRKPDKIEILNTVTDCDMPYHLIKEIYYSYEIVRGERKRVETSRLVNKTIRDDNEKVLTDEEKKKKEEAEKKEVQEHSKKLLKYAEKKVAKKKAKKKESKEEKED